MHREDEMWSPSFAYAAGAVAAAVSAASAGVGPVSVPWTDRTITAAVIGVSMFWIRRSDRDARRERKEMRDALHRRSREIAVLVKGYTDDERPLPADYSAILLKDHDEDE